MKLPRPGLSATMLLFDVTFLPNIKQLSCKSNLTGDVNWSSDWPHLHFDSMMFGLEAI